MTLNTIPAGKVRTIVGAERLDHMSGFAIATLAAMKLEVFYSHRSNIMSFCKTNTNAASSIGGIFLPLKEHEPKAHEETNKRFELWFSGSSSLAKQFLKKQHYLIQPSRTPRYESSPFTIRAAEVNGCGSDFPAAIMCVTSTPLAFR